MKGVSAESRKKQTRMLKQVQHDSSVSFCLFVIPNQVLNLIQDSTIRDLGFGLEFGFKARPVGGFFIRIMCLGLGFHNVSITSSLIMRSRVK